ncbi:MAG TPA: SusD/RagB family nutrient-binding outer membrane lipoprotein [Niabella sp.]|nr:SusD/RagB family nutrient-binding outer membrane lipoprotein [Niabella sp.]
MKNIFYFIFILLLIVSSCSKKIEEAYLSPNSYTKVEPEELLPQIISSMAANYGGHGPLNDARDVGAYIKNYAFYTANSVFDMMGYTNSSGDVAQSTWRTHFYDIGQNNQKMMQWAKEQNRLQFVGVGKAIEAWSWLMLTDYYGDVIVKQAFETDRLVFNYDDQETAYNKVRECAMEAIENLEKSSTDAKFAEGDKFFYNGDINKWKKFANSVLARYYNHFSNKSSYKPDSAIFYAERGISSTDDIAAVKYVASNVSATNNFYGPFRNNLAGTGTTSPTAIRQNEYIANMMNGTNSAFTGVQDPRAWYLLRGNVNGTIKGVASVAGQTALPANDRPESFFGVSQVAASNAAPANDNNCRFIFRNDSPIPVITDAEMKFIIAEAAFRKGDKAKALQAYKDGINAHFNMLTTMFNKNIPAGKEITEATKSAYMTNPTIVPASANDLTLTNIMMQKYIAMFGYGVLETWMDMRRYHYTDIDPQTGKQVYADFTVSTLDSRNNGKFVYRYYPRYNSEWVWNFEELKKIGGTNTDYHTKELWITTP